MKNAVIIFVRNPELGKVKTRLAATVGDEEALNIYCLLLNHTMQQAGKVAADKFVFYHQQIKADDIWNKDGFYKKLQTGESLGDKMKAAFDEIFNLGYNKIMIIGSDCLQLNSTIINAGFGLLDEHDTVIGPATDGGYYLLGMKKNYGFLFDNKAWSTENVFDDSMKDMQQHHLSTGLLPVLTDVDTEADWIESKILL
jgi:hypothetical protein